MATYYMTTAQFTQLKMLRQLHKKLVVPMQIKESYWQEKMNDSETISWNRDVYTLREGDIILMRNLTTGVYVEAHVQLASNVVDPEIHRRLYGED